MCVCAGGYNNTSCELSTEKYDPAEDTWTEIPVMNFYSEELDAEVIDDTIFVISGKYIEYHFVSHVACFNDKENRWHKAADMNICRSGMSTCVIENLPNASDYAYKHRDKLMEEKCKKRRRNVEEEEEVEGETLKKKRRNVKNVRFGKSVVCS
ncbi:kelch-like protein 10 [Zootermopsis nevadensis]|uniref:kelch-like protein 10 n=1 Tax=Zootermopsis nevadensis TaxID=136037 RepID=UPI000B8EC7F2|nr:kelch-like protein 10 [Zootermopsis nevadensis]